MKCCHRRNWFLIFGGTTTNPGPYDLPHPAICCYSPAKMQTKRLFPSCYEKISDPDGKSDTNTKRVPVTFASFHYQFLIFESLPELTMGRPRIFIADDHRLVLEALQKLLEPHYDVVGTATDGLSLLEAAPPLK